MGLLENRRQRNCTRSSRRCILRELFSLNSPSLNSTASSPRSCAERSPLTRKSSALALTCASNAAKPSIRAECRNAFLPGSVVSLAFERNRFDSSNRLEAKLERAAIIRPSAQRSGLPGRLVWRGIFYSQVDKRGSDSVTLLRLKVEQFDKAAAFFGVRTIAEATIVLGVRPVASLCQFRRV